MNTSLRDSTDGEVWYNLGYSERNTTLSASDILKRLGLSASDVSRIAEKSNRDAEERRKAKAAETAHLDESPLVAEQKEKIPKTVKAVMEGKKSKEVDSPLADESVREALIRIRELANNEVLRMTARKRSYAYHIREIVDGVLAKMGVSFSLTWIERCRIIFLKKWGMSYPMSEEYWYEQTKKGVPISEEFKEAIIRHAVIECAWFETGVFPKGMESYYEGI